MYRRGGTRERKGPFGEGRRISRWRGGGGGGRRVPPGHHKSEVLSVLT